MKKLFSLFAAVLFAGSMMAVEVATATFNGKNAEYTEGWTTTGTGVGRTDCVVVGAGENITSPAFDFSEFTKVYVAFSGRRYGSLAGSKATVNVAVNGTSVGSIDITSSSVGVVSDTLMFTATANMTDAVLVFTCTNATSAGSSHGAGIGSITIIGETTSDDNGDDNDNNDAAELLNFLTFPDYNDSEASSYTATWTATVNGATWTIANFNNNKNGWNLIKCGRKGTTSVASITTPAFKANVTAIVYNFAAVASVDSAFLYTMDGNTVITKTAVSLAAGKDSFAISDGQSKYSYKLVIHCASASGNGPVQLNSVKVYGVPVVSAVEDPVFDVAAGSYYDAQTIHLTCATDGAVMFYTTDGSEPTSASNLYMPQYGIYVAESVTIKAIAYNNNSDNPEYSDVVEKTYTIAPQYASLADLVNAGAPAGQKVVVTLTNEVIDSLYTTSAGKTNGIYLTAAGRMVEIFCYDVPAEWIAGGTVSGTVKGEWKNFNGTWEVCPSSWDGITYKAAAASTVTPPADAVIETYNGTGYSYATYDDEEWEAQVAISGNKMYVKNIFPNMQNTLWIVGTISNGQVVFAGGQALGEQDQTLMGGEDVFTDCVFFSLADDMETLGDATFSWNETTKTLKALDYEVVSYTALAGGINDAFDGTSDPDVTLTLVGTGSLVPTSLDNLDAAQAVKFVENGQVIILRDGVRYNALGQVIE